MLLQMQLSPLWAGLAVYSSKIINDKKEIPEYTSGISFFADYKKDFSLPYKAMPAYLYAHPAVPTML